MAIIHLVSPQHFERWDFRNPNDPGIGGSETMHVEMVWRLAALGHTVHSYVPRRSDTPAYHRGVRWHDIDDVPYTAPGLFIFVRGLGLLSHFPHDTAVQSGQRRIWCVFQDTDERQAIWQRADEYLYQIEKFITLCPKHQQSLQTLHPDIAQRVVLSRNGIRGDLVDVTLALHLPRAPHRLLYASSPDRGLKGLLTIFPLIRFLVPDAELHICYGFDNMEKLQTASPFVWRAITEVKRLAAQPGVIMRGRMGQPALYREWAQASVMCAPTNFQETGYITLMEAQALGAIPIVNPLWAAEAYQLAGIGIQGDAESSSLTLRQYAMAAVHLLRHFDDVADIRAAMMQTARKQFDWQDVALQYDAWIKEEGI